MRRQEYFQFLQILKMLSNICLKNLELDIFEKSENPQKMKKLVISAILSTDVTQHFKNL